MIYQTVPLSVTISNPEHHFKIESPIVIREFKYLGHMINNEFSDDDDIKRKIRNLFMRTNVLIRRYNKCSISVKLALFRAYCIFFYDVGIWLHYSTTVLNKLKSCYNKCVKMFFLDSNANTVLPRCYKN